MSLQSHANTEGKDYSVLGKRIFILAHMKIVASGCGQVRVTSYFLAEKAQFSISVTDGHCEVCRDFCCNFFLNFMCFGVLFAHV